MEKEQVKNIGFKKWGRRALYLVLSLALLILALRLSLRTSWVQNWVKGTVVETANSQLNGTLYIDNLSGDLWKEIKLSNLQLRMQDDTLAHIDSISASYNIWALLQSRVDISQLMVSNPRIRISEKSDQWNVQKLKKESEDTTSGASAFSFDVSEFQLKNGQVSVISDSLDLNLEVRDMELASSFSYSANSYSADLQNFSFQLRDNSANQNVDVESEAQAGDGKVTLERLMLATGQSLIQSTATFQISDTLINAELKADPLAWKDINRIAKDVPLRQDLQMTLNLDGTPDQFNFDLNMQGDGIEQLHVGSQFQWQEEITLNKLDLDIRKLNSSVLFADSTLPSLHQFSANFTGQVPLNDFNRTGGDLHIEADSISRTPYLIDSFRADGTINPSTADIKLAINKEDQALVANLNAEDIWEANPSIKGKISGRQIDPQYWAQDSSLAGNVSFSSSFSGKGWYPDQNDWNYSIDIDRSRIMNQPIGEASFKGNVSSSRIDINGRGDVGGGSFSLSGLLRNPTDKPAYNYKIETKHIDLAQFTNIKNFETNLNSEITGKGSGFSLEDLKLSTSIRVDSSVVNGEPLNMFSAQLSMSNAIAVIESGKLQSSIASGQFSARLNVQELYDLNNELSLDLDVKNLMALAPLASVNKLDAVGNIKGRLQPTDNRALQFSGAFDLSNPVYGDQFSANRAYGSVDSRISTLLQYKAQLNLESPVFAGVNFQDLEFSSQGMFKDSTATGTLGLEFSSPEEGRIVQSGDYFASADSIHIQNTEFNIISDYRTLSLESPFDIVYADERIRMDRMRVSSGDGAYLEVEIPELSESQQQLSIGGKELNIAVIQSCLVGEVFVEGLLGGQLDVQRFNTDLQVKGAITLSEVEYQSASLDSLHISGDIANNRLKGTMRVYNDNRKIVVGDLDAPFRLGDPEAFPSSFFEERVSGTLVVNRVSLEEFQPIFEEYGITQTTGVFTYRGELEGDAGSPKFSADGNITNATLSGVKVDSINTGIDYDHQERRLDVSTSVISLRQKAAEIEAHMPFHIDLKTFAVNLPQEGDSVSVDVTTNNFNLAAINDFLDRKTLRQAAGRLNGDLLIEGKLGNLRIDGRLKLQSGKLRVVPLGITIDHVNSTIQFEPNKIFLSEFSAESGKGRMNADGTVALKDMLPGEMDINLSARNFRIANTEQYNAVINMNTKASGQVMQPKVTGSVDFISGFLQLDNFGEKSVETVKIDSLEETGPDMALYDSLAMNMQINFDRRFYIRNQRYLEMEVELDGSLNMLKDRNEDLQLFGTITAPSGYARPLGKEFNLQDGNVIFSGDPTNPQLMIRTRYMPPQTQQEIVIWYIIEGTVEKPQFKYESQPPMELENIISYTLFGQPFYALDSWKQVVAGSGNTSAANVALDVLLDRVEALATKKLGIDVVKIDNTQVGGETGTSITTGWYLNPRVFFAIQNIITGSTPDTSFLLEYLLREDLKLILRQGNGIRQGIDIKWNYEY